MPVAPLPPRRDHDTDDGAPVVLDLRALPAPEPMMRALAAVDALGPGEAIELLTPLVPTPLLEVLAARGLLARAEALPAGGARVSIRYPDRDGPTGA